MSRLRWAKLREATAVASSPALLRGQDDPDGPDDADNDDAAVCSGCGGSGIKGGEICPVCSGAGSVMRESTHGDYWVYADDPEFERLREASRTFSTDVRKKYSASGVALSDGSYPIPDKDALDRAVSSYGRNPTATVKAHIVKRARALGATDALPDGWQGTSKTQEAEATNLVSRIEQLEATIVDNKTAMRMLESKPASMTPTFSTPTRVKTSGGQEGYRVTLIREGRGNSEDDQWYTADAIREMVESGVCEGMQAFGNHPTEQEEEQRPERDVKQVVGTYHDVKFAESGSKARADAIFVPLTLDEAHPQYGWVVTLAEAAVRSTSQQPLCGISLFGLSAGDDTDRPDGTYGRMVSMVRPQSGDVVTNAGAGGGFIRQLMESARALRNRSGKELTPMKAMAYQSAVREAVKRVREATSDDERTEALEALAVLEAEKIDNVPDTIEQLREAAPGLVTEIESSVKAEAGKTEEELRTQLREAQRALGGITDAIGITEALREAGVEDPVELRHYAGMANSRGLREAKDIKEMVETDRANEERKQEQLLEKMREAFGTEDSEVEGAGARMPVAIVSTDGGVEALRESGIPTVDAE